MKTKPNRARQALPAVALALALLTAACSSSDTAAPSTTGSSGPVVVTDALGRETTLAAPPQRITVAGRATFMIVDALYLFPGVAGRLVAVESLNQSAAAFIPVVDPDFADIEILGRNAGAEQIAATDPDLVILKTAMAADLGPTLEQLGIPVVYVDLETPEQFARDIAFLGEVLGEPERATAVLDYYQARQDAIAAELASLDSRRPTVLLMRYNSSEGIVSFEVSPAGWLQTMMVELAGGTPVWTEASESGGWTKVGFEQIAAWNPDEIFVIDYSGGSQQAVAALEADPAWQQLAAVAAGDIYAFPGDFFSWDQPDPRWILGLSWLFTKVQPELSVDIDIMAQARDFFSEMYAMEAATFDSDIAPILFGTLP